MDCCPCRRPPEARRRCGHLPSTGRPGCNRRNLRHDHDFRFDCFGDIRLQGFIHSCSSRGGGGVAKEYCCQRLSVLAHVSVRQQQRPIEFQYKAPSNPDRQCHSLSVRSESVRFAIEGMSEHSAPGLLAWIASCCGNQLLRVGVLRVVEDLFHRSLFHDLALAHDEGPVADMADNGEVVRNQQQREGRLVAKLAQQFEDLGCTETSSLTRSRRQSTDADWNRVRAQC